MNIKRLRWYAARLAAMSPLEVGHRVIELAKKKAWARNLKGWDNFPQSDGKVTDFPELRQRLKTAWPASAAAYEKLRQGMFCGLGREVAEALGPSLWFADPVTGKAWPGAQKYCFDIDVRSTGGEIGDIKFIWEINRLQFLHPLACAIAAEPREDLIARAFAILENWKTANPPFRGVNWFSGIELAMRMVTVCLLAAAIPPDLLDAGKRQIIRQLAQAHAFWLHRYPSRFSSANNHLVAEGLGLFLAGRFFPDLPHAAEYDKEGRAILESEAQNQIFPDGVGGEQSPTYQAFTMEMLAFAALIGDLSGAPLAALVKDRLRHGAAFLQALMDERGAVPQIGDDDEGRVIGAPPDREPRYVASVVAAIAGLLNESSLLPPGRDAHVRDAVFAVPEGSGRAENGLRQFKEGGYSVARETIAGRDCVLTFDHGPLGYLSLAAHGHSDALAVWLSVGDRPVIVDAGTFLYHSGGAMREKLRSSGAHNTLSIKGLSQSRPSAAFSWANKARARLDETREGRWWSVAASHDGYWTRLRVRHRRVVTRTPNGFTFMDSLEKPREPLDVEIGFLIHPSLEITRESDCFVLSRDGRRLALVAPPLGLFSRIVRDDSATGAGLHSPRFGELIVAPRIVFTGAMKNDPVLTRIDILPK